MPAVRTFVPKPLPRADLDWRALVPSIGRATLALARYDGILHGVPDPAVLLSPLTTQEAVLSSKIEGTQATLGDVLRFEAGEPARNEDRREDIHEILNYRRARRADRGRALRSARARAPAEAARQPADVLARRRDRSAGAVGAHPCPVRDHPPVPRRQRADRPHSSAALSLREEAPLAAHVLPLAVPGRAPRRIHRAAARARRPAVLERLDRIFPESARGPGRGELRQGAPHTRALRAPERTHYRPHPLAVRGAPSRPAVRPADLRLQRPVRRAQNADQAGRHPAPAAAHRSRHPQTTTRSARPPGAGARARGAGESVRREESRLGILISMNSQEFKYDVAFSFLQQDEPLAMELNDRLQDRVKTFIYSEQQKEIAGKDGEEGFNKVFGEEARIVVVLYRAGWGESRWTRIEQTAIRNRGHEHGYRFAKFIPLDEPPTVPKWLPATQIWIGLKRHGLDGAAAVIEARVQDVGGTIHEETIEERAKRLERNIQFRDRREKFQWDRGVQAARIEVEKLKQPLESKAATVKKSSSIDLNVIQNWGTMYLIGLGRALGVHWKLDLRRCSETHDFNRDACRLSHKVLPRQWTQGLVAGPRLFTHN